MNALKKLITDIVESSDIFVEDIKMSETGGTVKVICDTEKGIDSSLLVALTRKILNNPEFDEKYAELYRLEVSSPGLDMPLTKLHHFKKNIGRDIELKHTCKDVKDPLRGTIEDVNEDELVLAVRIKKENSSVCIAMKDVVSATLRLKW